VCRGFADAMPDRRNQRRIRHEMVKLVTGARRAIAALYKDGNDLDRLRHDPLLKLAVGRAPRAEATARLAVDDLASENAPAKTDAARSRSGAPADQWARHVTRMVTRSIPSDERAASVFRGAILQTRDRRDCEASGAPLSAPARRRVQQRIVAQTVEVVCRPCSRS